MGNENTFLSSYCEKSIDLVIIEPPGLSIQSHFRHVHAQCSPSMYVINNVNLDSHAGWIRNYLLVVGGWTEVLTGSSPDFVAPSDFQALRSWTLLVRDSSVSEQWVSGRMKSYYTSLLTATPEAPRLTGNVSMPEITAQVALELGGGGTMPAETDTQAGITRIHALEAQLEAAQATLREQRAELKSLKQQLTEVASLVLPQLRGNGAMLELFTGMPSIAVVVAALVILLCTVWRKSRSAQRPSSLDLPKYA